MFINKIDKSYSFSAYKDSSLSKFKLNFGNDFVYKEFDSNVKRLYVGHISFKGKDVYFPKPPLYFEFKNENLKEFGVVKPGFMSINLKRLEQGKIIVKKEKIFPVSKKH